MRTDVLSCVTGFWGPKTEDLISHRFCTYIEIIMSAFMMEPLLFLSS